MVSKAQRITIFTILAISTVVGSTFFFFVLFQCGTPVTAKLYWQRRILGQCVTSESIVIMSYSHAAINTLTDLSLAILPIPTVLRSRIRPSEKKIVYAIFGVASIGCIASAIRIYWIPALASTNYDLLNEIEWLAIWSTIEPGLGIVAACLATLRPLLRTWRRSYRHYVSRTGGSRSRGYGGTTTQGSTINTLPKPPPLNQASINEKTLIMSSQSQITRSKSPLKSLTVSDMLGGNGSGDNDILNLPKKAYIQFNPTSPLDLDFRWSSNTLNIDQPVLFSIFDETRAPPTEGPVMFTSNRHSIQAGKTMYQRQDDGLFISRIQGEPSWYEKDEQKDRSNRATWWPLPVALNIEGDGVRDGKEKTID